MRLWLNRTAEVSLREQLITQIVLGVLSHELEPGQRLPSTRELARRFGIHANTASSAYKQLEEEGWVEFRHGSGVYVRPTPPQPPASPEHTIDGLIAELLLKTRTLGISPALLRERLNRWIAAAPPTRWLLIDPDPELRAIVLFEMEEAVQLPVAGCSPQELNSAQLHNSLPLALPSKAEQISQILPAGTSLTVLQIHPVGPELHEHLNRYRPSPEGVLIGIASRWAEFQRIAHTMLIAAGLPPECLVVRDATETGWQRGLEATTAVVCDAALAPLLPAGCRALPFTLLATASLLELRALEANYLPEAAAL
jgi:GntR family transcriptional regulator